MSTNSDRKRKLVSENLRFLRKRVMGWTQEELAEKLDIKRSLLGAYEESRAEPRLDILKRASLLFNITLDSLLTQDLSQHKVASFPNEIRERNTPTSNGNAKQQLY